MNEMNEIEETNPKKGNTVLLTIIAVATLLVAVIGATFAYFSVTVVGNEEANSVIVRTGMLGVTFNDGNEIIIDNLVPGDERLADLGKEFTLVNTGDFDVPVTISWDVVANTFGQNNAQPGWYGQSDFTYSLTVTGAGATAITGVEEAHLMNVGRSGLNPIPTLTNINLPANTTRDATQTWTLSFQFPNLDHPQDYDQARQFSARIQVSIHGDNQFGD